MATTSYKCGLVLAVLGTVIFSCGVFSDNWVSYDLEIRDESLYQYLDEAYSDYEEREDELVSSFGPWRACTYGGHCGAIWKMLGEINKASAVGIQLIILMSLCCYLIGVITLITQTARPDWLYKRCVSLDRFYIAEFIIPTGVVLGFVSMLLVGQIKQVHHPNFGQTTTTGWGFIVTLVANVVTVAGSMLTTANKDKQIFLSQSGISFFIPTGILRIKPKKNGHLTADLQSLHSDKTQSVVFDDSHVNVFITTSPCQVQPDYAQLTSAQGDRGSAQSDNFSFTQVEELFRLTPSKSSPSERGISNTSQNQHDNDHAGSQNEMADNLDAPPKYTPPFSNSLSFEKEANSLDDDFMKLIQDRPGVSPFTYSHSVNSNVIEATYHPPDELTDTQRMLPNRNDALPTSHAI